MDIIQLKIEKDNSVASYIKIIRKFDDSLSVGTMKQRIDNGDFVIGFDLEYYDALEDINEIDRKKLFRQMIEELCQAGAKISIYQDNEKISIDTLDNRLETLDIISQQVENDIDRETQ
ncbi:MAG: hypothetical protein K2K90_08255 [Lachnospiraceae bacterium]|nr:hypothetical protein [Lachnospiraceae bacterium]